MATRHSESARQAVHMAMGGFALLLRWLSWWQAVALAAVALAFNLFALPRIGHGLYRPGDRERGVHGIVFYPMAVLFLLLLFPRSPAVVAAAWGVLAIGDGVATLVGRAVGGRRWPWNREKTVAGSAAFAIGGAAAGAFLARWCGAAGVRLVVVAPIVAAIAAAAVETIPVRLDDNLSVAITAGVCMALVGLIDPVIARANGPVAESRLAAAFAVNIAFAAGGYAARAVSRSGAIAGAAIGIGIYLALGWQGWTLLFLTFALATVTSRMGLRRKVLLGIAEERGGRRGAGNAIANTGVAAIAAGLAILSVHAEIARWAFAAALAAGGSDTVASEIGKAWGRTTWSITSLKRVPPGTSGAVSAEGTGAGILGAIALAAAGVLLAIVPSAALAPLVVAATLGSLVESALGATLEAPGILNNDMLNFINTAVAALAAAAFAARMA